MKGGTGRGGTPGTGVDATEGEVREKLDSGSERVEADMRAWGERKWACR